MIRGVDGGDIAGGGEVGDRGGDRGVGKVGIGAHRCVKSGSDNIRYESGAAFPRGFPQRCPHGGGLGGGDVFEVPEGRGFGWLEVEADGPSVADGRVAEGSRESDYQEPGVASFELADGCCAGVDRSGVHGRCLLGAAPIGLIHGASRGRGLIGAAAVGVCAGVERCPSEVV